MKDLKLKDIVQHLLYGVKCRILNYKCDYVGIEKSTVTGYYYLGGQIHLNYAGGATGKVNGKDIQIYLKPLNSLKDDEPTLLQIALIADCHFVEIPKAHYYDIDEEDGCYVCRVMWRDERNPSFEISWAIEHHEGLDDRNGNITIQLGDGQMVHNPNRIVEYLYSQGYDIERLIERGIAMDVKNL